MRPSSRISLALPLALVAAAAPLELLAQPRVNPPAIARPVAALTGVPQFRADPTWPTLPTGFRWGQVIGINADSLGHVWTSSSSMITEWDAQGRMVQQWSARGPNGDWNTIHGMFVDHNGFVWTNARESNLTVKFTREGKIAMVIGCFDLSRGSNDTYTMGRPSEIWVDPTDNEVFVADGYGNRRIVVLDGSSGRYLRHWGAYGRRPVDGRAGAVPDPAAEAALSTRPPECRVSGSPATTAQAGAGRAGAAAPAAAGAGRAGAPAAAGAAAAGGAGRAGAPAAAGAAGGRAAGGAPAAGAAGAAGGRAAAGGAPAAAGAGAAGGGGGGAGRAAAGPPPAEPPQQFSVPHGIIGSRDGLIYLADRANNRVQVFRQNGDFVAERILRPKCGPEEQATWTPDRPCGNEAAFSFGFSHDLPQTYLYVADGGSHFITVLRRSDLAILYEFGGSGLGVGQLGRPHNMTVDPNGNIYVAEAAGLVIRNAAGDSIGTAGFRAQKFTFTGVRPPQ